MVLSSFSGTRLHPSIFFFPIFISLYKLEPIFNSNVYMKYKYIWQYLDFPLSYKYSINYCLGKVEKYRQKRGRKEIRNI